jgi:hypothetical protein
MGLTTARSLCLQSLRLLRAQYRAARSEDAQVWTRAQQLATGLAVADRTCSQLSSRIRSRWFQGCAGVATSHACATTGATPFGAVMSSDIGPSRIRKRRPIWTYIG